MTSLARSHRALSPSSLRPVVLGVVSLAFVGAAGCKPTPPQDGAVVSAAPSSSAAAAPTPSVSAGRGSAEKTAESDGCGGLDCRTYPDAAAAFEAILAKEKPLVLAIGEAHAQKGATVDSSTKRFTDELLTVMQGKASDLVVEAMLPPPGCKPQVAQVREKQKAATAPQAQTNQSEYVVLGTEARKHGIVPDLLRPSCGDLDAIDKAGDDAIGASLSTIARLTVQQVDKLLARNEKLQQDKTVIAYGGALHNDLAPGQGREDWSYAARLVDRTKGRYVEVDLFVPDFIRDDETWRKFEWRSHYDPAAHPDKAVVYHPRDHGYVVILPHKAAAPAPAPAASASAHP
jgi:hypothetical protein